MKYQINYTDTNGTTSAIDTVSASFGYTAADYIKSCEQNADEDWFEMLKKGTIEVEAEPLYIITEGPEADSIYGEQQPICLTEKEVRRLSNEWGKDLFQILHEADEDEIKEYRVYED